MSGKGILRKKKESENTRKWTAIAIALLLIALIALVVPEYVETYFVPMWESSAVFWGPCESTGDTASDLGPGA